MGYDVHITRAEYWFMNEGRKISAEEWQAIIRNDPELIHDPADGEHFVRWYGSTQYPETWFDWYDGNIKTKWPDKATLRKMLQIAALLDAHVQGDDEQMFDEEVIEAFDDSFLGSGDGSQSATASASTEAASWASRIAKGLRRLLGRDR